MKWNFSKNVEFFCLIVGFIAGCSHSGGTRDIQNPDSLGGKNPKQITFFGDNEHPRFSLDGARILYSSRARNSHKGVQIYEMDLRANRERRVVFSDGDAFDASYISDYEILYSSTTDEIKENPLGLKIFPKEYPPSELYMSDLYGNDIIRLTTQPSYDGDALLSSNSAKPFILFTSRRGDLTGLYRLDLENLPVSLISAEADKEKRYPTITPDQKTLAWSEKDLKTGSQKIVLYDVKTKATSVLKSDEGEYRDLFFAPRTPQRLFYSILRKGELRSQIEVYDLKKQCTQVVLKDQDSLLSPAVSNDSTERLAFSRLTEGKKQIYVMNLPEDLGPCLEPPTQATLKE